MLGSSHQHTQTAKEYAIAAEAPGSIIWLKNKHVHSVRTKKTGSPSGGVGDGAHANDPGLELAANLMVGYTTRREPQVGEAAEFQETSIESRPALVLYDRSSATLIENDRKLGRIGRLGLLRFRAMAYHRRSPIIVLLTLKPLRLLGS